MSTSISNAPYVHLDKTMAPTRAASAHNKQVIRAHDNLGQGAEQVDLIEELLPFFVGQASKTNKSYNAFSGGPKELQVAMAAWMGRMFGLYADPGNVSVAEQQGRGLFNDFANRWGAQFNLNNEKWRNHYLSDPKHRRPAVLVPRNSWSLAHTIYNLADFEIIEYDIENGDIAGSLEKAINTYKDDYVLAAAYMNFPHNATGLHLTDDEGGRVRQVTDHYNQTSGELYKMALHLDVPYYGASPLADVDDAYLETGLRHIFDWDVKDPKDVVTPTIAMFSGSKFMRTAQTGFSWEVATPDLTKMLRSYHNMSGNGVRYDPVYFDNLIRAFQPENDHLWHKQLGLDRTKFSQNRAEFERVHGEAVLPGGANLVGLMILRGVFGKAVMCHDGVERYIPELGDTPEEQKVARQAYFSFAGNGTPFHNGVILVDGDVDKYGNPLARVAMSKPIEDFIIANERVGEINEYIRTQGRDVTPEEAMTMELA